MSVGPLQPSWERHMTPRSWLADYKDVPAAQAAFFRAWELYKADFVATAPISSQTELSMALAFYTANLYELATQYSWNGMLAYRSQVQVVWLLDSLFTRA
jgi:hypothetical protein